MDNKNPDLNKLKELESAHRQILTECNRLNYCNESLSDIVDYAYDLLERTEAAQQRIAELDRESQNLSDQLGSCYRELLVSRESFRTAEAELARRDKAAGRPDGYIFLHPNGKLFWSVTADSNAGQKDIKPFYFAALPAALPPDGWKLVPVKPTQAMCEAMYWATDKWPSMQCDNQREMHLSFAEPRYLAALAAAPAVPGGE